MTEAIAKAQQRAKELRESGDIPKATDVFERFAANSTRKSAIDAFCGQCMGGPDDAGYRQSIRACPSGPESSQPCPLFQWRPYQ